MIKTGDNVMVGGLPTDIVIPCESIHRFFSLTTYLVPISVLWAHPELEKAPYAHRDFESLFSAYDLVPALIVHQHPPRKRYHARRP